MIEIKGGKKEQSVRQWINKTHEGKVPRGKVLDSFIEFENRIGAALDEEVSYGLFNGVLKKIITEGGVRETKTEASPVVLDSVVPIVPNVIRVEDLVFPEFKLHKTGKKIDDLFSDHEVGGGIYGGTVNIVIGESGTGNG